MPFVLGQTVIHEVEVVGFSTRLSLSSPPSAIGKSDPWNRCTRVLLLNMYNGTVDEQDPRQEGLTVYGTCCRARTLSLSGILRAGPLKAVSVHVRKEAS